MATETQTWFKTNRWDIKIDKVQVSKETEKQVEIVSSSGHKSREGKITEYGIYFKEERQAYIYLKEKREKELKSLLEKVEKAKSDIGFLDAII